MVENLLGWPTGLVVMEETPDQEVGFVSNKRVFSIPCSLFVAYY